MLVHAVDKMRYEIERVEQMLPTLSYTFRPSVGPDAKAKRGWFNGIGDVLSMAFGLATTEQLEAADEVTRTTQGDLVKVLHINKQLVTLALLCGILYQ